MDMDRLALDKMLETIRKRLLDARCPEGHWQGRLSASALSTAVAVFALSIVDRTTHAPLIDKGLNWLTDNQNADGGWGDTVKSLSNISTTMLCWSALSIAEQTDRTGRAVAKAEFWLRDVVGGTEPAALADALERQYGKDKTFSVPILAMCALAGRLGPSARAWRRIKPLPFELAVLPHRFFKLLRLPVVSYALPALIAIGQTIHHHRRGANPLARLIRSLARRRTLKVLQRIQPENGGFLEAAPLTAFVVMSLASAGHKDHPVVAKGTDFLVKSVRSDGSWPIDTNLSTWVTTLSVNALALDEDFNRTLPPDRRDTIHRMLLASQYRHEHPYTHAAPGGWAWTALPGAVPDADDTAGALIALHNLGPSHEEAAPAAARGITWLLDLQNRDGGIPTFCRGWTNLPFDRSAPDITAHALSAFAVWRDRMTDPLTTRLDTAAERALEYLKKAQQEDGSWIPLWFGNQHAPSRQNPTYGTARVMTGLHRLPPKFTAARDPMVQEAARWLLAAQNGDGGWGGDKSVPSSIEETALAVDALADLLGAFDTAISTSAAPAVSRGLAWLAERTGAGTSMPPAPIGLYFAKLWYFEDLYPLIFTVSALQKAANAHRAM